MLYTGCTKNVIYRVHQKSENKKKIQSDFVTLYLFFDVVIMYFNGYYVL